MNAYALHQSGDCWPDNCPLCANQCDTCGEWLGQCTCPPETEEEEA